MVRGLNVSNRSISVNNRALSKYSVPSDGLLHHYDTQDLDGYVNGDIVSEFPDKVGDNHLVGSGTYRNDTISGNPVVETNGSTDEFVGDIVPLGDGNQYTRAFVVELVSWDDLARIYANGQEANGSSGGDSLRVRTESEDKFAALHMGIGGVTGGTVSTNPLILIQAYDGEKIELELDGQLVAESFEDIYSPAGDLRIANVTNSNQPIGMYLAEGLFYNEFQNKSSRNTISDYYCKKWDLY